MKYTTPLLFLACLLLPPSNTLLAQCNPQACATPVPSVSVQDACILPSPDALRCYVGQTLTDPPVSLPPYWCSSVENNQFFGFIADSTEVTLTIGCGECSFGSGVQAAILRTSDCINFDFVSYCLADISTGSEQAITATGLTPGQVYYLMIDGLGGALCSYTINRPNIRPTGPTTACIPGPAVAYTSAAPVIWSIFPPDMGIIAGSSEGKSIDVIWAQTGMAEVCVSSVAGPNAPDTCITVHVGDAVFTTDTVQLCPGNTIVCAGVAFGCAGTFPVTLNNSLGCDSVVSCVVNILPAATPDTTTLPPVFICAEGGYHKLVSGVYVTQPGTYTTVLPSVIPCTDSIVLETVALAPAIVKDFGDVLLCPDACFQVCNDTFCTPGSKQARCTASPFCDSTVVFNAIQLALPQRGVVYADANANGVRDIQEPGIPGLVVFTSTGFTDTTDALGAFAFDVLNTGDTLFLMPQPGDSALHFVVYDAAQPVCYDLGINARPGMVSTSHLLLSNKHLKVYPNPTRDRLYIEWTTPSKAGDRLQLYDAQGRLIKSQPVAVQTKAMEWNIGGVPPGAYMVVLHTATGSLRKWLVVQ